MQRSVAVSLSLAAVLASATALAAARAAGGPDTPMPVKPKPVPSIEPRISLPPYIHDARLARPSGVGAHLTAELHTEGPLAYDVEVVNPTSASLSTRLVVERLDGAPAQKIADVPVEIEADARVVVPFTDPGGLRDGCGATRLRLSLETGTSSRTLTTSPACTFTAQPRDPGASLPASRQAQLRAGRLTYQGAALASGSLACGAPLSVRATLKNGSSLPAAGVRLRLEGPSEDGLSPRIDLAPGREETVTATLASFAGHAGSYALRLDAAGSAPVHQPGWVTAISRTCRLEVGLER